MTDHVPALLVPPVRLGRVLHDTRVRHGESRDDLVRRCGLAYDEAFFVAVEEGRLHLDEPTVRWLAALYDVPAGQLVPQRSRLVIDLAEGSVAIGDRATRVGLPGIDELFASYLGLVYELRGLPNGAPIKLRELDLDVLAEALQLRTRDVQHRLHALIAGDREPINGARRWFRNRLVVPLAGILVGVTSRGAVVFEGADEGAAGTRLAPEPRDLDGMTGLDLPIEIDEPRPHARLSG